MTRNGPHRKRNNFWATQTTGYSHKPLLLVNTSTNVFHEVSTKISSNELEIFMLSKNKKKSSNSGHQYTVILEHKGTTQEQIKGIHKVSFRNKKRDCMD